MADFQAEKDLVRGYFAALDDAGEDAVGDAVSAYVAADYRWRGFHPFGELNGAAEVAERFWQPLRQSLTRLQRRQDVFMAGRNEIDGFESVWVVSMGHLMGLFDVPWLGIRPTGRIALLRYCEFHRVAEGRIAETAMYFDIPNLMAQAGQNPFPPQTGAHLVQPGPLTHDGLLFGPQPAEEGVRTLAAINAMIADLGQWQLGLPIEYELARTWHDDMVWWGPEGIGATYTIPRYARQHAGPFRAAFTERSRTGHVCRMAEGHYGGFFGWPNFTARHTGGFMGLPGSDKPAEFRVVDIYRREGDKLAENWIFIDMLHFYRSQGVDLLARMSQINDA
jgi:ketosteroid isomerase-like protein